MTRLVNLVGKWSEVVGTPLIAPIRVILLHYGLFSGGVAQLHLSLPLTLLLMAKIPRVLLCARAPKNDYATERIRIPQENTTCGIFRRMGVTKK